MTIRKSVTMMSNTGVNWNVIGEPIRGNSYYGYGDSLSTVQIITQNLVGRVAIQATLSLTPAPEDWFYVRINPAENLNNQFITFPLDPLSPTGANGGDTGSWAFTFSGNFVYLRAILTRDYLQPVNLNLDWNSWAYGQIDKVLLSL